MKLRLESSDFDITNASDTELILELYGETLTCPVNGSSFSCDTLSSEQEVSGFNATLEVDFNIAGEINTEELIDLDLEANITNCNGSSCGQLGWILPYPCTMNLEAPATY